MPIATRRPVPANFLKAKAAGTPAAAPPTGRAHLLDLPFDMRGLSHEYGVKYDDGLKAFIYRGDVLPAALSAYASEKYSWQRLREDELNGIEPTVSKPEKDIILRKHQKECVLAVRAAMKVNRSGFLIADDVGLGKTIETWTSVLSMTDAQTILIVCPLAVVAHWRRTIRWMGDMGKRIVVINYDRLKSLFEISAATKAKMAARKGKKRKIRSARGVARFADAYEFDVIVWDECHKLRRDSARSKLAAALSEEAGFELWLSATTGQGPTELRYLAPVLAEVSGTKPIGDFAAWCQSQGIGVVKGKSAYIWRGDSKDESVRAGADDDLEIMRKLLFEGKVPVAIRRTPTDIAGWPEVNRILLPVELTGEDRALYNEAWSEFRRQLDMGAVRDSKNGLVARLRFRQKSSLLRTGASVDLALDLLEQGLQVAISVAFLETMDVIVEALTKAGYDVATISGRETPREKEAQRLDFQYGRKKVVVYTVEDAISLHEGEYNDAKRVAIIHDLRWSGIGMHQIQGRTHRDGKASLIYWMVGADTVEEDIAKVVGGRMRAMGKMQGDDATVAAIEEMLQAA